MARREKLKNGWLWRSIMAALKTESVMKACRQLLGG